MLSDQEKLEQIQLLLDHFNPYSEGTYEDMYENMNAELHTFIWRIRHTLAGMNIPKENITEG